MPCILSSAFPQCFSPAVYKNAGCEGVHAVRRDQGAQGRVQPYWIFARRTILEGAWLQLHMYLVVGRLTWSRFAGSPLFNSLHSQQVHSRCAGRHKQAEYWARRCYAGPGDPIMGGAKCIRRVS